RSDDSSLWCTSIGWEELPVVHDPGLQPPLEHTSQKWAGRQVDALELWERIVPVADERRGPAHGDSLTFRRNWIWALEAERRWAKAADQRRELVAIRGLGSDSMLLGR